MKVDSGSQQTTEQFYGQAELHKYQVEDAVLGVRVFGQGPALVLIHGYPVHGYTWRKLLPRLARDFKCYVIDLPGLGDSDWSADTDFTFTAQARRLGLLFDLLKLNDYAIIAHDTGATLARLVALDQQQTVKKLVIINTEIPNHRPPWIPFYQLCAKLPFASVLFQGLLRSTLFVRSSMGLGQFYSDGTLFREPANIAPYMEPLITSASRTKGMLGYLKGIQWSVVDELSTRHKDIQAEVLFLWGEDDKTFPVGLAEDMSHHFSSTCIFVRIKNASLLPHEERADEVLEHLLPFLLKRK